MRISKVYFSTEDNLNLIGLLHTPEEDKAITVVISTHGITSNCLKYRDDVIAKVLTDNNIAYFTFNNRGHDVLNVDGPKDKKTLQGSGAENITDSYFDIKSAIEAMYSKGFQKIVLQGHSLGCTKTVYTYNRFLEEKQERILKSICGISLLSMVDVPGYLKMTLGETFEKAVNYLKSFNEKEDVIIEVSNNFMPVKPKTALNYVQNKDIDFFKYNDKNFKFEKLNNIKVPLFMRWGNVNELISIDANDLVKLLNEKINNRNKDINYIENANHSYNGKEKILADEILKWMSINYLNV